MIIVECFIFLQCENKIYPGGQQINKLSKMSRINVFFIYKTFNQLIHNVKKKINRTNMSYVDYSAKCQRSE